jgi:hypothetical protein
MAVRWWLQMLTGRHLQNGNGSVTQRSRPFGDVGLVTVREGLAARTAADAVGPVTAGLSVFGVSAGGFGVVDILEHLLASVGPVAVWGSTWTIGAADSWRLARLLSDRRVTRLRLLVDASFAERQPAYHAAVCERFGPETICYTRTHAKFLVARGGGSSFVLTTSSNMDRVVRLEWFSLVDDARLADYLVDVVDRLFASAKAGETFARFVETQQPARSHFGDGPLDTDLRRSGWTYARTGAAL